MKKIVFILLIVFIFLSCYNKSFSLESNINVITREQGSGTRGAFLELFELEEKSDVVKRDLITKEASVENNTNNIIQTVTSDINSIGYISLGSLNENVKTLKIDGAAATSENLQNGTYNVKRNFNIVYSNLSNLGEDFINFIFSKKGQDIVNENLYIPVSNNLKEYNTRNLKGKLIIGGSSSVAPLMEKLVEEYSKFNTNANIELQISDSTTGISKTKEGVYNIGLTSRELKDDEKKSLKSLTIAIDGIAIIVNNKNTLNNLTKEDVKKIYLGDFNTWKEVVKQ